VHTRNRNLTWDTGAGVEDAYRMKGVTMIVATGGV
jgi:hypothetical protein